MQLLLLNYNNYFNRIIKKKDTVADYKAADTNNKEFSNITLIQVMELILLLF